MWRGRKPEMEMEMDNNKVLLLFARIRCFDVGATLELLDYATPTIQSLAKKWRKGAANRLFKDELENAGSECVLSIAKKLSQPPPKWVPPASANDLRKSIESAIREARNDAKGTTSRERRRASRWKADGKGSPRVPLIDGQLRFAYNDANFVYVDELNEIIDGCCVNAQDRTIIRLSLEMDDLTIAKELDLEVRTIQKSKDIILARYDARKARREGLAAPKVERASAVERVSEKANGVELALGA
jgi:hypothetical protein